MTRLGRGAVLVVLAAVLSGCIGLPREGPIVDAEVDGQRDEDRAPSIDARSPRPGASRLEIVNGFLEAMMAWPISTSTAKQYLTADAAEEWSPDSTVIYTDLATPREDGSSVTIRMRDATLLDGSGGWRGVLPPDRSTLHFRLTVEDGEFRILDPVDALVVRTTWFQQRYRQASLYFFDPTAEVLVPEPVFVPVGETFATNLVAGLLAGPPARLRGIVTTFIPPSLSMGLSVPVDEGIATLDLRGDAPQLSSTAAELMLAQLAATLRQEPSITALQVAIDGEELDSPGAAGRYEVSAADEFDPADIGAPGVLYGIQRGRLVSGTPGDLILVEGPLSRDRRRFASAAVSPIDDQVAAVATDLTEVVIGPLWSAANEKPAESAVEGTRFTQPSWDASGRLWLLDRTRGGARVLVHDGGREAREVDVPQVTGSDARRILVSRDGTRLVALVDEPGGDVVVAARVVLDGARGKVAQVVDSTVIHRLDGRAAIDLAWTGSAEIAVLTPARPGELFEVETVSADGATIGVDTLSTMVSGPVIGLAGEPYADTPVYAVAPGALVDIRTGGRLAIGPRIRELDYAG